MSHILLCDGNASGCWYKSHLPFEEGQVFSVKGSRYVVRRWPTDELVGVEERLYVVR